PSGHPAADPEGLGFIRSGKHDPVTNGDRLATQRGVEQLLDRGVERVEVRMEDSSYRFHPVSSPRTFFEIDSRRLALGNLPNITRPFTPIVKPGVTSSPHQDQEGSPMFGDRRQPPLIAHLVGLSDVPPVWPGSEVKWTQSRTPPIGRLAS